MTVIFRGTKINKDKLIEMILRNPEHLQSGLSFIDLQLGTGDNGFIDFLGIDNTGRLVIVNIEIEKNNEMLVSVLSQMQWLKKNESLINRLYFSMNVDFDRFPQVFLVGPGFSEKLKEAAKQLSTLDIKCIEFKYLISEKGDGIVFEEVFYNRQSLKIGSYDTQKEIKTKDDLSSKYLSVSKKPRKEFTQYTDADLTPEEIKEFIGFDGDFKRERSLD